jgi:RNA-splicing ligase RtcB
MQSRAAMKNTSKARMSCANLNPRNFRSGREYFGLAEEASAAYKDVSDVVRVCHNAGISKLSPGPDPSGCKGIISWPSC